MLTYYLSCFALELPTSYYDVRLPFAMYFSWFYLRFLMLNPRSSGEVGDAGPHFALHTFIPGEGPFKQQLAEFCDRVFQTVNESTGAFDYIQRKFKSPLQNTSHFDRKK